jgi:hypothetical protein
VQRIFISYRRADAGYAGRVFDRLRAEFGDGHVFRDVDAIEGGTRFPDVIARQLDACRVFVLIVGPAWWGAEPAGGRRLHRRDDWVRIEVARALERNICIVPVTVGGAAAPRPDDLPDDLKALSQWQVSDLRDGASWGGDVQLVVNRIARELGVRPRRLGRRSALAGAGLLLAALGVAGLRLAQDTPPPEFDLTLDPVLVFDNRNKLEVFNRPTRPATFTIDRSHFITYLYTYHWNGGRGSPPTPGTIGLRRSDGTMFGPWEASASSGFGGAPNVDWYIRPNIVLPAGTYEVIDSEPQTWSHNDTTGNAGVALVRGHPPK